MVAPWQASQQRLVYHGATVFRKLLSAMSRPGTIEVIPPPDPETGIPRGDDTADDLAANRGSDVYNRYAVGALATLLDRETTFALAVSSRWLERESSLSRWLERFTGGQMVPPWHADFALCLDGRSGELLPDLRQGTDVAPEEGATAFICVSDIADQPMSGGTVLELRGPGIRETAGLTISGLPDTAQEAIAATRHAYPLGLDVILIDSHGRCVGLPRTTRVSTLSSPVEEG